MSFPRYPAYKDSGVEWLGEVPEHWEGLRLRFAVTLNPSKQEARSYADDDLVSFLPMEAIGEDGSLSLEIEKEVGECLNGYTYFKEGDVCIAKITPCYENGKGAILRGLKGGIGFGTTELIVARPRTELMTAQFLDYLFKSSTFRSLGEAAMYGAGGQKRVPDSFVRDFASFLPPVGEQSAIATFLDRETAKIDALIAEQQRLIKLLQEKRQAVISHAVTKGLNPDAPMKDSGVEWLGEVPEHWVVKKLKHLLSQPLSYGANEPADLSNPELPRYIRITDIQEDGTLNAETFRSLPAEKAEPYMLIDKDILLARSGATVGKAFLYKREFGPCCFAGYLILARLEARSSLPEWFRLFTESSAYWGQVKSDAIQATIQNVSAEKYGNILISMPPKDELVGIVRETKSLVEYFERTVSAAMRSISLLHERRSALISAAVTGQIDVRGLVPAASAA